LLLATVVHTRGWAYAVVGAFAGVYLFYHGFRILLRKRLIENTPTSKIRSASMGLVEVNGLATGPYTINAPLSGVPCYLHRTVAWEWRRDGRSGSWVKAADETLHVPFFLDDNTGRVLVDPRGAEMEIHRDFCHEFSPSLFSSDVGLPGNVASFLSRYGVNSDHKIKVEEYCIKPKNALFVLGTLAENHSPASATLTRTDAASAHKPSFRLSGLYLHAPSETGFTMGAGFEMSSAGLNKSAPKLNSAQRENLAAAMMKAGITNPAAWAAAGIDGNESSSLSHSSSSSSSSSSLSSPSGSVAVGSAAAAVATAPEKTPEPQYDLRPPVVLMRGVHNPAFFISWQSQREVVRSLGWKSAAMIWGGPALTLACVYFLAAQLGWL
jgi:hypothetical protein